MATHATTHLDIVRELLAQHCEHPQELMQPQTLLSDLEVDSLMCIDLSLSLESLFGRQIHESHALKWKSIQDILNTLMEE